MNGSAWKPRVTRRDSAAGPQGSLPPTPRGVLLHGSRSGRPLTYAQEFDGTVRWAQNPDNVLGWHATVAEGEIALHVPVRLFGWNAFAASSLYVAIEYAQPTEAYPITDLMVRTANWFIATLVRPTFPRMPLHFPSHAEVEHSGETGHGITGKSDAFSYRSPRMDELRERMRANLADEWHVSA